MQALVATKAVGPSGGVPVQRSHAAGIDGLDRFIYLCGSSGRRYVFSAVARDRAALYDDCVFAWREAGATVARPCLQSPLGARSGQLYVHLIENGDVDAVLADLRAAYEG